MIYENVESGTFVRRINRFVAEVIINGKSILCHVKNTGRLTELLTAGTPLYLSRSANPQRKTAYDLICVEKFGQIINIDSQAPNAVFDEFLRSGGLGFAPEYVKREAVHGSSRFDFYFEANGEKCFTEVKGVTLKCGDAARFPDAPTTRGIKHINGLIDCVKEGFTARLVFIIQMKNVVRFEPNVSAQPEFADMLERAASAGVIISAYDCEVLKNRMTVRERVDVGALCALCENA